MDDRAGAPLATAPGTTSTRQEGLMDETLAATPLVALLKRSVRVVAVQPWMVEELGLAAIWFAQCLWRMQDQESDTITAADDSWLIETGLNRAQVHRARAKVLERGWITCRLRRVEGAPTTTITLSAVGLEAYLRANVRAISDNGSARDIARSSISLEVERELQTKTPSDCALPGIDAPPSPEAADAFDAFWDAFEPKVRRVGKPDARRAWLSAIKGTPPAVILTGQARYNAEIRGRSDVEYLKTPGPWLRAERWADEPGAHRRGPRVRPHGAGAGAIIGRDPAAPQGRVAAGDL